MWNDLTMQQRADVISMAVKAGMRDMKSIRSFYDETLRSRRFEDGGGIKKYVGDLEDITYDADNMKFYEKATGKELGDSAILDELIVNGRNRANDYLTEANDNTSVYNVPHREYNQHLKDRAEQGAREAAIWREEHPNLSAWGEAAASIPLAVASVPLIAGGAEALAGTSAGQAASSALLSLSNLAKGSTIAGAPAWAWADAGLTSAFGAHGASEIAKGNVTPETLLDVAPLGQLVKGSYPGIRWLDKKINYLGKQLNAEKRVSSLMEKLRDERVELFNETHPRQVELLDKMKEKQRLMDKLQRYENSEVSQLFFNMKDNPKIPKRVGSESFSYYGKESNLWNPVFENMLKNAKEEDIAKYLKVNHPDLLTGELQLRQEGRNLFFDDLNKASFDALTGDVVKTGDIEIVDAATGKSRVFKLDPKALKTESKDTYQFPNSEVPIETTKARALYPEAPKEYLDAVQKNIDFITQEALPNSKVFGSSANVVKGNLYHDAHDIDVIMTQADAAKHPEFKKWTTKNGITYKYNHPTAGEIDVNILQEGKNGMAVGDRAHELYAQMYPEKYAKLMKGIAEKNPEKLRDLSKIPLDKTPKELLDNYDPVTKTIADAFSSHKGKHMKRAVYLLHYGNPKDVQKGFDMYANYILGGQYKPSNVPLEAFKDPVKNEALIDELGLKAINKEQFINDPERMKLLFEYGYFNEGFLGRGVDSIKGHVTKSLTYWWPNTEGGTYEGVGLNTVLGGDSGFGDIYAAIIPEKLGMEIPSKDPIEALRIRRALLGDRPLSEEEIQTIEKIASNNGIDMTDVSSFGEALGRTSGKRGENYKKFLSDLEDEFGIAGIKGSERYADNSHFVSITKDQSPDVVKQIFADKMDRPLNAKTRDEYSKNPNKASLMKHIFKDLEQGNSRNTRLKTKANDTIEPYFKTVYSRKRKLIADEYAALYENRKRVFDRLATINDERRAKVSEKYRDIYKNYKKIEKAVKIGGVSMSVGAAGALISYLIKNANGEELDYEKEHDTKNK